ncbi:cAMP-dependent protein kinase catalytic subunit [Microsporum canis]|uniref:cAMP-dependent protein kinase n=1 Tax=Arthroderma otae (strain ATCC MYA-4605 / CBS 113480) TaxID=554155 RepID=C5FNB1_ARTOC|nr:cAMP-dependent protein kinase type 3 [Microsporum canis CBS 113480]EEQ31347.1 cAMP-dependent protein kinase type 3 [Microsporum canis CBS 113480]
MPTFGGLLKKRRTKDSKSKDFDSPAETTAAAAAHPPATAASAPAAFQGHTAQSSVDSSADTSNIPLSAASEDGAAAGVTAADSASSALAGAGAAIEPPSTSVTPALANMSTTYQRPNTGDVSQSRSPQQTQPSALQSPHNVTSIKNIINPPHHDDHQQQHQQLQQHSTAAADASIRASQRQLKGKYSLGDFSIHRTLGTGSFGRVHLVQSIHNQRFYAIKVLKKAQVVKLKQVEHTNDERAMLERVKHPFLVTLWGTFQDAKNLYMVMDFAEGGELFSLLRKSQRFPNPVAKFYAAEVTLALEYLHSKHIVYRDLKPENLLLDKNGHLKITDFGFAKEVRDITWTLCGTPDYLAPEVVSSKGYNKSVDWWSLGILIFEMLCGFTPFWDSGSPMKIYENILKCRVKYPPSLVPDAQDLLSRLITPDLTKRLGNLHGGSQDVKNHPWFAEVTWELLAQRRIDAPYIPPVKGGSGDACMFDTYAEETEQYGLPAEDEYGHLFREF